MRRGCGLNERLGRVPHLTTSTQYVFFLFAGDDGTFYPLAGGAAMAIHNPDGSFALTEETTGIGTLSFTLDQLTTTPPPDLVTLTVLCAPLVRVDDEVQSGSLTVTRSQGILTGVTGAALVAGRGARSEHHHRPPARLGNLRARDGMEYTLVSAIGVPGRGGAAVIVGTATAVGNKQAVLLQVVDR